MKKNAAQDTQITGRAFSSFIGNTQITDLLDKAVESEKIHQAYLFTGPAHLGKTSIAQLFAAKVLNAEHQKGVWQLDAIDSLSKEPDYIQPEDLKQSLSVEEVRKIAQKSRQIPLQSNKYLVVLPDVEQSSEAAMNALLKVLEEPASQTVFILTSSRLDILPETIQSRCQILSLRPLSSSDFEDAFHSIGLEKKRAQEILLLSNSLPGIVQDMLREPEYFQVLQENAKSISSIHSLPLLDRNIALKQVFSGAKEFTEKKQRANIFLQQWLAHLRSQALFLLQKGEGIKIQKIYKMISRILLVRKQIEHNTSPEIALEYLVFSYEA